VEVTIIGSISGVRPTATDNANKNASAQSPLVKPLMKSTTGAMDVLCTDKTGTLTQDKIFLSQHIDVQGGKSDFVLMQAFLN
ncbi:hypothetical protein IAF17_18865, partial [Acinetobacter baumannii]|nr:hypothetical protein [Acinetobacter baumannii]